MLSIRFAKDKDKTNYKLDISHHPAPVWDEDDGPDLETL